MGLKPLGPRIKHLRDLKGLTQEEVAKKTGYSKRQIERIENGASTKRETLDAIAEVLGAEAEDLIAMEESFMTELNENESQFWNVPFERHHFFEGRDSYLKQLHSGFFGESNNAMPQAVTGLGGIGKTQIAVEYAFRNRKSYRFVFWVGADSELDLVNGYSDIADKLGLAYQKDDSNSLVTILKTWLKNNENWLFIFDNADHPNKVKRFQPKSETGHVLFTSRASVLDMLDITNPVELPPLTTLESINFLRRRTGKSDMDQAEKLAAERLSELLEGLPLALEQAAAYIVRTRVSFTRYLQSYEKQKTAMFKKFGAVTGDYTESVATTWLMNFEEVRQISEASADLLRFSSFLAADHIPFELVASSGELLGPNLHEILSKSEDTLLAVAELLEPLTRFSLVRIDAANESYSMHRLVQEVIKDRDET